MRESSDSEPIPRLEPLPRRKKAGTKVALRVTLAHSTHISPRVTDILIGSQEADHSKDKAAQVAYAPIISSTKIKAKAQDRGHKTANCEFRVDPTSSITLSQLLQLGRSGESDLQSDSSASSDIPLTALQNKRKKHPVVSRVCSSISTLNFAHHPRTSQEHSKELTADPPRKKARALVSKKGKEKAGSLLEHEDSDHAGSLFSGSEGRSSPDVSLATKGK